MKYLGIDAGYRNLGWVLMEDGEVLESGCDDLVGRATKRPIKLDRMIQLTMRWCAEHEHILKQADFVVLERQMKNTFKHQNTVIRANTPWKKQVMVHPVTLSKWFGIRIPRAGKKADTAKLSRLLGWEFTDQHRYDAALLCHFARTKRSEELQKATLSLVSSWQ